MRKRLLTNDLTIVMKSISGPRLHFLSVVRGLHGVRVGSLVAVGYVQVERQRLPVHHFYDGV